ncbi:hypothetical protein J4466_04070 [Candidatus Pacearchaeota archaeon]|nr:hypothetical protein [Candidatus Pacearchaeota archaeon]
MKQSLGLGEILTSWLNEREKISNFPWLSCVNSIEEISDGQNLIIINKDTKLRVYEDVRFQGPAINGVITMKFHRKYQELRYSFKEGKFVREEKEIDSSSGLISDREISKGNYYVQTPAEG